MNKQTDEIKIKWKENRYGRTARLSPYWDEDEIPDDQTFPLLMFVVNRCVLLEKRTAGSVTTYKIKYEDKEKRYFDRYNDFVEMLNQSFPSIKPAYHKDGFTYFQIKSSSESLMSLGANKESYQTFRLHDFYLFENKEGN